jgi:hypothetical protein
MSQFIGAFFLAFSLLVAAGAAVTGWHPLESRNASVPVTVPQSEIQEP